ncbi:MAG: hypothetical protein AAGH40_08580 [Verrucomicrobiota bacterium]
MWRQISALFLFISFSFTTYAEVAVKDEWKGKAFTIEDSRCYVGIAKVLLSVSELKKEDGYLVGDYTLNVPLIKSKSDFGRIKLPVESTFNDLKENGGVLIGKAYSRLAEGKINKIVCEIIPSEDQSIRLAITTDKRTINFVSRYTIVEKSLLGDQS